MNDIFDRIYRIGIVPVVTINQAEHAVPLAEALERGGIPTAEITFRTSAAREAIAQIAKKVPGVLVGAGTVTSIEMAKQAIDAGAKYIVSPGLNPKVVSYCIKENIPLLPGVSSPTEIEAAMDLGLTELKFFPAEQLGGCKMLTALAAPYPNIRFIPTGGIHPGNLNEYLGLPNVIACGGSFMCPTQLMEENKFNEIERLCRQAVLTMHGFSLLHVGMNCADANEAKANADLFANMFSLPAVEYPNAYFAGSILEIMKEPFLGEHGHIAIGTNNMDRAIAYFDTLGCAFRKDGIISDGHGILAAYFEREIGGFAIHLRRK